MTKADMADPRVQTASHSFAGCTPQAFYAPGRETGTWQKAHHRRLDEAEFSCRNSLAEWSQVFVQAGNATYYETRRHRGHGGAKITRDTKADRGIGELSAGHLSLFFSACSPEASGG